MSVHDIVSREAGTPRPWARRPYDGWVANPSTTGETLTMRDGSRWWHPYSGGAPIEIR